MERDVKVTFSAQDSNFSNTLKSVTKSIQDMYSQMSQSVTKGVVLPDFEKIVNDKIKELRGKISNAENASKYASVTQRPGDVPKYQAEQRQKISGLDTEIDKFQNLLMEMRAIEKKHIDDEKMLQVNKVQEEKRKLLESRAQDKEQKDKDREDRKKAREEEDEDNLNEISDTRRGFDSEGTDYSEFEPPERWGMKQPESQRVMTHVELLAWRKGWKDCIEELRARGVI